VTVTVTGTDLMDALTMTGKHATSTTTYTIDPTGKITP
jgi:hypothetical protein